MQSVAALTKLEFRMALGAGPAKLLRSVLGHGMALVAIGIAVGLAVTLFVAHYLEALLFGVSPRDPLIYLAVISGVTGICLLANFVPARRAATVDPMEALRTE